MYMLFFAQPNNNFITKATLIFEYLFILLSLFLILLQENLAYGKHRSNTMK